MIEQAILAEYEKLVGKEDPVPSVRSAAEHLRALQQLKTDGLINEEEYNTKRKEILGELSCRQPAPEDRPTYPARIIRLSAIRAVITRWSSAANSVWVDLPPSIKIGVSLLSYRETNICPNYPYRRSRLSWRDFSTPRIAGVLKFFSFYLSAQSVRQAI